MLQCCVHRRRRLYGMYCDRHNCEHLRIWGRKLDKPGDAKVAANPNPSHTCLKRTLLWEKSGFRRALLWASNAVKVNQLQMDIFYIVKSYTITTTSVTSGVASSWCLLTSEATVLPRSVNSYLPKQLHRLIIHASPRYIAAATHTRLSIHRDLCTVHRSQSAARLKCILSEDCTTKFCRRFVSVRAASVN